MTLSQTYYAVGPGQTVSFLASGGNDPYTYAVLPFPVGPGGTIDASTGVYTAPAVYDADPRKTFATIQATDDDGLTTTAEVMVATVPQLFCEILQRELGLARGRVYLWNQNIEQPTDSGLYIAVSILREKVFANSGKFTAAGNFDQSTNVMATFGVDIISRGPEARDQKELVLMALFSQYAEQQMEKNCFFIGKLPAGGSFTNLSNPDGAAIPYRFHFDINVQYAVKKSKAVDYFDEFEDFEILTNS